MLNQPKRFSLRSGFSNFFVNADSNHQHYSKKHKAQRAVNPVNFIFHDNQKNNSYQKQGGHLIPDSEKIRRPFSITALQFLKNGMTNKMIDNQACNKSKFDMHEWHFE